MTTPAHRHTPRSAANLLSHALGHVELIEPPAARGPVRAMLLAAIEQCVVSLSLLGKPVVNVLNLAQCLIDEAHRRNGEGP